MDLLPNDQDQQARRTRYWVSSSRGDGLVHVDVEETPDQIEDRLKIDYPTYRILKAGKTVAQKVVGFTKNEV